MSTNASNGAKPGEDIEMKATHSHSSELAEVKQNGLLGVVKIQRYWLLLFAIAGVALLGLAIGLYFIGESNGAAMSSTTTITSAPIINTTPASTPGIPLPTTSAPTPSGITPTPNLDYRLPRNVFPVHYKLTLFPNLYLPNVTDFTTTGWEIITVSVLVPTDRIFLHADRVQLDISSVQLFENLPDNEEPLPTAGSPAKTTSSSIALLAYFHHPTYAYYEFVFNQTLALRQYKLRLSWSGKLERELYGLYLSSYTADGSVHYIAATQFQATYTRRAFPCFDEPDMKAVFEPRLIRSRANKAQSNTDVLKTEQIIIDGKDYQIDFFEPTPVMSSYLNAFSVNDYVKIEYNDSQTNVQYRFWGRPGWLNSLEYISSITKDILNHFDRYYGTQYPLKKMEFIGFPDFALGGMENWGLIMFADNLYYYDAKVDPFSQKERIATITAHELSHMNFGNLVTCKWWDDAWLNEGFASFLESSGMSAVEPTWNFEEKALISDILQSMRIDCTNATRPISQAASSPSSIATNFDSITYSKGASLCLMMSAFLTEETFRKGLMGYLSTNKYGNAAHKNLFDSLTAQTIVEGKNLDVNQIMQGWTTQAGYPVITGQLLSQGQQSLTIKVSQTPFELDTGKFGHRTWWIPIHSIVSTNPSIINPELNWLSVNESTITISDSSLSSWGSNDWYILNANHNGFYRVNYDLTNWQKLTDQLHRNHKVINALTRTVLIDDAHNLARGGYPVMSYSLAFNMTNYLYHELSYAPWQATIENINYVGRMFAQTRYNDFLQFYGRTLIQNVYNYVGWEDSESETNTKHFLRTSITSRACRWEIEDCLVKATNYFQLWKKDHENYIPPKDTISTTRCYGIQNGTTEDWWWLYSLYTNTALQSERNNFINALGCSNNETLLKWFLNVSLNNPSIPGQEIITIYTAVASNPIAYEEVKAFFYSNWETLLLNSPTQSGPRRILDATFQYTNTQDDLDELLRWKQTAGDLGGVEANFNNVVVTIRNNIAWMQAHETEVGQWVEQFYSNPVLPSEPSAETTVRTTASPQPITSPSMPSDIKPTPNLEYRLPRTAVPVHYKLTLFPNIYLPNPSDFVLKGWLIVTINVLYPTNRIFIHALKSIRIDFENLMLFENLPDNEEPLALHRNNATTKDSNITLAAYFFYDQFEYYELVFDTALAMRQYKLRLSWTTPILRDNKGLYYRTYNDSLGPVYMASTEFQAASARKAFPCFDEPDLKAVFESRIIRNVSHLTLTNNDRSGIDNVTLDGQLYFVDLYKPTVPMSSYMNAFCVHNYVPVRKVDSVNGRLLRFWSRPEWVNRTQYIASITNAMLTTFDQTYGTNYPFNKLDFIPIPDFLAGALENWGLVTFSESAYYYDPATDPWSQKDRVAGITAHEVAHMNFGNLVTTKWWDDMWLNEGFASYLEYPGLKIADPNWATDERFLVSDVLSGMRQDSLNSTRALTQPIDSASSISIIFESVTYSKGASMCRMMEAFVSEATFRRSLKVYLRTYTYSNVVHKNLFDAISGIILADFDSPVGSPLDVNQVMDGWINQPGHPVLTASFHSSTRTSITFSLSQTPFELEKGKYGYRKWSIPYEPFVSERPSALPFEIHWFSSENGNVTLTDSAADFSNWNANGWFVMNLNHNGFYRINYEAVNWQRLTDQLLGDFHADKVLNNSLTRTQLIDDALYLARADYPIMTYSLALSLTRYLCHELSYAPWQASLDGLNYVEQHFWQTAYDADIKKYGRSLIKAVHSLLGWIPSDNETTTNHFLRASVMSRACRWQLRECLTNASAYFSLWKDNPQGYTIPSDTTSTVRCYGIKTGTNEDWWWLHSLYTATSVQSDRNSYINALGCSDDVTQLARFLNISYEQPNVTTAEFTTIYDSVAANPVSYPIIKNFFFENWEILLSKYSARILETTFQYVNTDEELQELLTWKQEANNLGSAESNFNRLLVTIDTNIAWMKRNRDAVVTWITAFHANPQLPPDCTIVS